MHKPRMALIALFSLLAMLLVMIPAAGVKAAAPPVVDGLFYGDPDGAGSEQPDVNDYLWLAQNPGLGNLYFYQDGNTLYLAVVVDPSVNDNVFGDTSLASDLAYVQSADWTGGGSHHTGKALLKSDHAQIQFWCGAQQYDWNHGYLYDQDGDANPKEADWLSGPGDDSTGGGINVPPSSVLLASASSLMWNLNYAATHSDGWDVTLGANCAVQPTPARCSSDSWKSVDVDGNNSVWNEEGSFYTGPGNPPGDGFDDAKHWEWAMVYELALNVEDCPQSWGVNVPSAHNSPPKTGGQDVPIKVYDFGDLPDGYDTTLANDGARHQLVDGGPILGFSVDAEPDGQPTGGATGDDYNLLYGVPFSTDDEDGVLTTGDKPVPGTDFTLEISGTQGAILDAWFDWNNDGVLDTSEHYRYTLTGTWTDFDFAVPTGIAYPQTLYARFRVTTAGIDTPGGEASDGEVEDYVWSFSPTSVGLVSFTATANNNLVLIQWETANEVGTLGYNLERADSPDGDWTHIHHEDVAPGGSLGASYDYPDAAIEEGRTYYYRLGIVDVSGGQSYYERILSVTVPAIDGPLAPRSPAALHRIYLPFVIR